MVMALCKFINIVNRIQLPHKALNKTYVAIQVLGLLLWLASYLLEAVVFMKHYHNLNRNMLAVRKVLIFNAVTLLCELFYFSIIGVVVYQTSRIQSKKRDPYLEQDMTLLAYLRSQFL